MANNNQSSIQPAAALINNAANLANPLSPHSDLSPEPNSNVGLQGNHYNPSGISVSANSYLPQQVELHCSGLTQQLAVQTNVPPASDLNPSALLGDSPQEQGAVESDEEVQRQETETAEEIRVKAELLAAKNDFVESIKCYEQLVTMEPENGTHWSSLGHCYLLVESLRNSFNAYQKALNLLPDIKDPQLWYGIGLLYEKVLFFLTSSLKPMNMLYQHLCLY